jgi:hypothetical protein
MSAQSKKVFCQPKNVAKMYLFVFLTVKKLPNLLKGVHSIIFVSNIFPNSHLIQKCIQNQQLF